MIRSKNENQFKYSFDDLALAVSDVVKVLQYEGGNSAEANKVLINELFTEVRDFLTVRCGYVLYDNPVFDKEPYHLHLRGVPLNLGTNLFQQFRRSSRIAVFLCTIGPGLDEWSRKLMDNGEFMKSHIAEVLGEMVMESALDKLDDSLKHSFGRQPMNLTNRISPGMCQWKGFDGTRLLGLFPPEFCNLRINGHISVHAGKVITGIVGVGKDVRTISTHCDHCSSPICILRRHFG
jgi:hypothetical protein